MSAKRQDDWHWQLSARDILCPWFTKLSHPDRGYVKDLPHRKVFCARSSAGDSLFIKQSLSLTLSSRLKFLLMRPLLHEYRMLKKLAEEGIPCIEALGYGYSDGQEILITRELEHCMTALEFWHRIAPSAPEEEQAFLHSLTEMLESLHRHHYLHGDFHPENILYQENSRKVFLVDPYKLKRCLPWQHGFQKILFCNGILFLENRLEDRRIADILQNAGLAENIDEAMALIRKTRLRRRKIHLHKYSKRIRKILQGESQFSRIKPADDGRLHIRNTPWHTPQEFLPEQLTEKKMPRRQARNLWLDSILPKNEKMPDRLPTAWLENSRQGQDDILYYPREPFAYTAQQPTEGTCDHGKNL